MRRVARWSAAIAVVVLSVLAAGVLTTGSGIAAGTAVAVAAGESHHECHGAPLQDVEHSAASPGRSAVSGAQDVVSTALPVCVLPAVSGPPTPVAPARVPPADSRVSTAELQVFRI
ncbi:hypothetical protein SAMN05216207_10619 [Pseudonocardia ammonioxydans]|uniref:Secreted protein n=1 Tax=Pseudonocardia ammonioxydans TaxID=260086 RepID=A0A1I5HAW2_PSUAM|nr:hypothetical protein [Pseudonocardia ammonioxydans]SFO45347.1 hypothetical protein SAMN05216207_10619 [Pseudonocardia ammonioxydans]